MEKRINDGIGKELEKGRVGMDSWGDILKKWKNLKRMRKRWRKLRNKG